MKNIQNYLKTFWNWLMKNAVGIIIALVAIAYVIGSNAAYKIEKEKNSEKFQCETSCFPQQNKYIYHGDVGSCWCYTDNETIKKYNKE